MLTLYLTSPKLCLDAQVVGMCVGEIPCDLVQLRVLLVVLNLITSFEIDGFGCDKVSQVAGSLTSYSV